MSEVAGVVRGRSRYKEMMMSEGDVRTESMRSTVIESKVKIVRHVMQVQSGAKATKLRT
jgi:hypothetical protein